jgi:hypothetical protein
MTAIQSAFSGVQQVPWLPADSSLVAAAGDPVSFTAGNLMSAGVLFLAKLPIRVNCTITNMLYLLTASGSGTSTGTFAGLYSSSGVLLSGSADADAQFIAAAGGVTVPLSTPQALTAGTFVWGAFLCNLSVTQPTLARGLGTAGTLGNIGTTAATSRWAQSGSGQTALPASFTPAALTQSATTIWMGAS